MHAFPTFGVDDDDDSSLVDDDGWRYVWPDGDVNKMQN